MKKIVVHIPGEEDRVFSGDFAELIRKKATELEVSTAEFIANAFVQNLSDEAIRRFRGSTLALFVEEYIGANSSWTRVVVEVPELV